MSGARVGPSCQAIQRVRAEDTIADKGITLIAQTRGLTILSQTDDVRRANLVQSAVTDINNRCHLDPLLALCFALISAP